MNQCVNFTLESVISLLVDFYIYITVCSIADSRLSYVLLGERGSATQKEQRKGFLEDETRGGNGLQEVSSRDLYFKGEIDQCPFVERTTIYLIDCYY